MFYGILRARLARIALLEDTATHHPPHTPHHSLLTTTHHLSPITAHLSPHPITIEAPTAHIYREHMTKCALAAQRTARSPSSTKERSFPCTVQRTALCSCTYWLAHMPARGAVLPRVVWHSSSAIDPSVRARSLVLPLLRGPGPLRRRLPLPGGRLLLARLLQRRKRLLT